MSKKDIDLSKYSSQQLEAARLLTDPEQRLTNRQIAEQVGISERQFYRWKEDTDFSELVNHLADRYMDAFIPQVYRQLMKSVNAGSVKALELALKRAGKLKDIKEVTSDVEVQVSGLEGKTNEQLAAEIAAMEAQIGEIK